jgi:hypothetical protein
MTNVHPLINGVSDHDAQIIVLHAIVIQKESNYFYFTREFNKSLALDFNIKLTYESWDNVISYNDVNLSFSNFVQKPTKNITFKLLMKIDKLQKLII